MTPFRSARKAGPPPGNKERSPSVPPVMGTVVQALAARAAPSPLRRLAAAGSLAAASAGIAYAGLQEHLFVSARVGLLGVAALVGVASLGLLRRSVLSQVLARATAWVVLLPMAVDATGSMASGHAPSLETLFFGGASAAALLLARPMLHTDAARAEFGPLAYRRSFLAGAVASAVGGIVAAAAAAGTLFFDRPANALWPGLLAAAYLASTVAVVRMRSWGVLLGGVISLVMIGVAAFSGDVYSAVGLLLGAVPGLVLAAPVVASRLRPVAAAAAPSSASRLVRVPAQSEVEPPFRARIDAGACDIPAGHVAEPLEAKDPRSAAR